MRLRYDVRFQIGKVEKQPELACFRSLVTSNHLVFTKTARSRIL